MKALQIPFSGETADWAACLRPKDQQPFVFLDSSTVQPSPDSRYALIARDLWYDVRVVSGKTLVNGRETLDSLWQQADGFLTRFRPEGEILKASFPELPFTGGLIGCLSYDFGVNQSPGPVHLPESADLNFPDAWLQAFDQMIVIDRILKTATLIAWGQNQPEEEALLALSAAVAHCPQWPSPPTSSSDPADRLAQGSNFTPSLYQQTIREVIEAIGAGEVYILNLTQRFELPRLNDPWLMYRKLRQASPTAYAVFYQAGDQQILSTSPEQFLMVRGRQLTTRPIKGTRPRGKTAAQDDRNREELLASTKDRAELLMIVDLERNDFSRVCQPDSVNVRDLFWLETYQTVFHLVATVEGRLAEVENAVTALKACFPGGSITGAPKIRAMQLISHFEGLRRGLYTGSFGYLSLDGQADFNILIRTVLTDGNKTTYHAGGGITWDSDPEQEYHETLDKAAAIGGVFDV